MAPNTKQALSDHQGTIKDIVDYNPATGVATVDRHRKYDPFGDRRGTAEPTDIVFGYTGKYFDDVTGLQNNWNRWYDPKQGRFISQDPIGFAAGDANLYRYVGNGPTSHADPSGNSKVKVIVKVGGQIQKVMRLSYDELRSLLRARVKDAQKPVPDRKYSGEVFVQVKDDKTAKKLAEQASPEGKCVRHEASADGHPPHYHPVKRYSEPDPNVPGSGGRPDTGGTPHIGSEYTGALSVAIVLPLLEQGGDLIIDASPIGDIRDIVTGVPEIVSGTREILVILSEESEDFYRIQQKSGMLGIQRLSTDGGAENDYCTEEPLRAGSWRKAIPPR